MSKRVAGWISPAVSVGFCIVALTFLESVALGADQPQWGAKFSRNMFSSETGLPDRFDPASGQNIKWVAKLGSQSYATPIVASGRVLIGTNNDVPRDPKHQGDRGVLMCFDESNGQLAWQLVVPKLEDDPYLDWPHVGMASAPTVEGNRVYVLSNRGEVMCLDLAGMSNGNDGPFKDESAHMTPRGQPREAAGPLDADIIWVTDLVSKAGIHTHDQVEGSILIVGDLLYVNSCNGVDNTHRRIRKPNAPSLVVLDKKTGRIVARDDQHIGPNIFHCQWSSPSLGIVDGQPRIFFGGADGVCYAFQPLSVEPPAGKLDLLKTLWRCDCDPDAPKGSDVHEFTGNRRRGPSEILGMPVFDDGKIYVCGGGDLWWGKHEGWLKCIDATRTGDITRTGVLWTYPLARETGCTPAIYDGMIFATDCGGVLHCVDATTGKPYWTYHAKGDFWASPMIADGKVYVGTRAGQFLVFAASKKQQLISSTELHEPVSATVTVANKTLYIATLSRLYAVSLPH